MARREHLVGAAVVDHFGRQHGDAAVPMLRVVPGEEHAAEATRVRFAAEAIGKRYRRSFVATSFIP